jgi:hypothetical protein
VKRCREMLGPTLQSVASGLSSALARPANPSESGEIAGRRVRQPPARRVPY